MKRGFFAIGIQNTKTAHNIGTLWRSAEIFGAAYLFTIGARYNLQASDTQKSWRRIPLINYATFEEFYLALPYSTRLVGIELTDSATQLEAAIHYERAVYLLGAEDHGLTIEAIKKCHQVLKLPGERSMNVATAGSIVMYDRFAKR